MMAILDQKRFFGEIGLSLFLANMHKGRMPCVGFFYLLFWERDRTSIFRFFLRRASIRPPKVDGEQLYYLPLVFRTD